jgi:hypothetical protein
MSKNKSKNFNSSTEMGKAIDELKEKAETASVEKETEPLADELASRETTVKVDPAPVLGVPAGCERLRIRKEPNVNSEILKVIDKHTVVKILEPVDDWFKVQETETIGYCMTKFIEIQ